MVSVRPAGSGGLTAKANGDVPPAFVTGVKAVTTLLRVRPLVATATAEVSAALTVRLKLLLACAPFASVTVTV